MILNIECLIKMEKTKYSNDPEYREKLMKQGNIKYHNNADFRKYQINKEKKQVLSR